MGHLDREGIPNHNNNNYYWRRVLIIEGKGIMISGLMDMFGQPKGFM